MCVHLMPIHKTVMTQKTSMLSSVFYLSSSYYLIILDLKVEVGRELGGGARQQLPQEKKNVQKNPYQLVKRLLDNGMTLTVDFFSSLISCHIQSSSDIQSLNKHLVSTHYVRTRHCQIEGIQGKRAPWPYFIPVYESPSAYIIVTLPLLVLQSRKTPNESKMPMKTEDPR